MFSTCSPSEMDSIVQSKLLKDVDSLIDIGPGIRPQSRIKCKNHICIEPHLSYINKIKESFNNIIFLNGKCQDLLKYFPDKSIDTILATDLIEHLPKEDGYKLLNDCIRIAKKQIIMFTPSGNYPQPYQEVDRWGMDGGFWQTHNSAWYPEDFNKNEWDVIEVVNFHGPDGYYMDHNMNALWVIKTI